MVGPTANDGPLFVTLSVTGPEVPGVIVGDDTTSTTSAERAPTVTVVEPTELLAGEGSAVVVATLAAPPVSEPGAVDDAIATGMSTEREAPLARSPAIVHDTEYGEPEPPDTSEQPAGTVPTVTPDGAVYVNVVGPTASDGPRLVAVTVTMPEVPGVIVGDVTETATSDERAPTVIVVGATVLLALDGSAVDVATVSEPPDSVPGACETGTATTMTTDAATPRARSPATTHVTVTVPPPPVELVQALGMLEMVTPAGGVYVNVVGPTASDGPSFVAVNVTVPVVPGAIVGRDTVATTSAERAPVVTVVGATVSLAGVGSLVVVEAEAEPPVIVPGTVDGERATRMATDDDDATARSPDTTQVTTPAPDTVQVAGSEPPAVSTVTPAGGV